MTNPNQVVVSQVSDVTTVEIITQGPQGPTVPDGDKGDISVSSNGTIFTLNDDSVTSAKIVDGAIVNDDINADASIALSKLSTGALPTGITVNSANIIDLSIVDGDISTTAAIAGSKIAPDFGAQEIKTTNNIIVGGLVDGRDLATDGTKLDTVEANAKDDQTAAEIRALTASATNSNVFTDADVTKLSSIETNAKDDQTAAEIKTLLQSDKITSSEIVTGIFDSRYYKETELDNGQLDNRYFTETELNNGQLDNRYYTETEADNRFFNVSHTSDIVNGENWDNTDSKIATTNAIDARIIDLVDDVGGFVPVANETSFPNDNPDINNGTGTLVSVPLANSITSNGSGVITIANGTVNNSTVTINGATASTTFEQGFGIIVETTSTLNTYTFHRYVPKATEVTTVAGNIQDINAVAGQLGNNGKVTKVADELGTGGAVTKVADDINKVTAVADDEVDIGLVAGQISPANNIANVASVKDNIAALDATVRGQISTITTSTNLTALQNAATNATTATNAKNAAETAQSAAETAETNAEASKTAAEAAKTAAEAAFDNFDDRYLGAKSTDPTLDNDGDSLINGALYFNTSLNVLKVYDGAAWSQITPTDAQQTNIDAVVTEIANGNLSAAVNSATNAATSESNAATSASNASANATTATEQATIATAQASSASSNATLVQGLSDSFNGVYLGALASDPIADSLGNFVNAGDIYLNTTTKKFRVFNGSTFDTVASVSRNTFESPQVANIGVFKNYAVLTDTKTATASGGSFLKNFWRVRDINTEQFDNDNIVSISNNQFTLQAGTYFIKASALSSNVGDNQLRIYNATDTDVVARGNVCQSLLDGANFTATVQGRVTITAAKAFEIQHIASKDQSVYGFGLGLNGDSDFDNQVSDQDFLTVEIYKESANNITEIVLGFNLINDVNIELGTLTSTSGLADENISNGKLVSLAEGSSTFDLGILTN